MAKGFIKEEEKKPVLAGSGKKQYYVGPNPSTAGAGRGAGDSAAARKIETLREKAKDKSLPQDVRNQMLDQANMLEEKAAKDAGVKLAVGGYLKQAPRGVLGQQAAKQAVGGYLKQALGGVLGQQAAKQAVAKKAALQKAPAAAKIPRVQMKSADQAQTAVTAQTGMAKGGVAKKELPKRGQRTATNMAKGGSVAKKAKK